MKFVDVKNDVAFRKIFGNEKKKIILISFLNAVLNLEGLNRVKEITLLNPFQLPRIIGEKSSIIDVKAVDERGNTFIVEMQVAEPEGLAKRALYYGSKDYAAQINSGDDYPKLRPVYFIGILNFSHFPNTNYFSKHSIIEDETGECLIDDLQFRFIELTKFKKKSDELDSIIDKWTYFIKNARNLEVIPDNIEDEGLKEAYQEAAEFNWSKTDYDAYIYAGMREQDAKGILSLAQKRASEKGLAKGLKKGMKEGLEKGMEKGMEKGKENERNRIVWSLNQNSVPLNIIAQSVAISEEEVKEIIKLQP
jgi:predicted transposase/invertase (TIGR01784 family)